MVKELISSKIKNIRTLHKLSQEEFAEKLDVSRQTVYYWESGKAVPDYNKIVSLCKEFDLSPNEFFSDDVCTCTIDEDCETEDTIEQTDKSTFVKKIVAASISLAFGIILIALGIWGIFWGFESQTMGLASVTSYSFNMSFQNVMAIIFLVIAIALVVLGSVLFARCGNKKTK